jgi:hypothetical protein
MSTQGDVTVKTALYLPIHPGPKEDLVKKIPPGLRK